jgi:hypothetical protein
LPFASKTDKAEKHTFFLSVCRRHGVRNTAVSGGCWRQSLWDVVTSSVIQYRLVKMAENADLQHQVAESERYSFRILVYFDSTIAALPAAASQPFSQTIRLASQPRHRYTKLALTQK